VSRARYLRKNLTPQERVLWRCLRNRNFEGWKFRRQHPLEAYLLDFYSPEARLVIEIDGGGHNFARRESLDEERARFLASKNIEVLRFWNNEVNDNSTASWRQCGAH
jgi:very-short-patch-repair endonuclease